MKQFLIVLILALIVAIGFVLYRKQQDRQLNVTPDARRSIEKAKQR